MKTNTQIETKPALAVDAGFGLPAKYWKAPFRYCAEGSCIEDANDNMILGVRGYGYLTGPGSLRLSDELACDIQDQLGNHLAKLLNASGPNA